MRLRSLPVAALLLGSTLSLAIRHEARAADWPQWMGPGRDNVWREDGLLEAFPEGGPTVVWRTPIAGGYAGPAVADGRVFVTDYVTTDDVKVSNFDRAETTGTERVLCLDEATGQVVWTHEYPVTYTISYPAGPRCTPTVVGDRVYTLGAEGHLICFDVASGDVVWSKRFADEYGVKTAIWGFSASPMVYRDTLICVVGGEGAHLVAFDLATGDERWRALDSRDVGYAPPTLIERAGVEQLLCLKPDGVASVDPATGTEYWSQPYNATGGSVIMAPAVGGDYVFCGGYKDQTLMLQLGADEPTATLLWGNKPRHGMSPCNVQPMAEGNTLYGVNGGGRLMAVDLPSGERLWQTPQPLSDRRPVRTGTAFLVKQADRYWMFTEAGEIVLARMDRDGYEEIDRAKVIEPTNTAFGRPVVWCMPAFANGRMVVRNDTECISVDLRGG